MTRRFTNTNLYGVVIHQMIAVCTKGQVFTDFVHLFLFILVNSSEYCYHYTCSDAL